MSARGADPEPSRHAVVPRPTGAASSAQSGLFPGLGRLGLHGRTLESHRALGPKSVCRRVQCTIPKESWVGRVQRRGRDGAG